MEGFSKLIQIIAYDFLTLLIRLRTKLSPTDYWTAPLNNLLDEKPYDELLILLLFFFVLCIFLLLRDFHFKRLKTYNNNFIIDL